MMSSAVVGVNGTAWAFHADMNDPTGKSFALYRRRASSLLNRGCTLCCRGHSLPARGLGVPYQRAAVGGAGGMRSAHWQRTVVVSLTQLVSGSHARGGGGIYAVSSVLDKTLNIDIEFGVIGGDKV